MADASRFPQGTVIDGSLLVARPVGTLVWDTLTTSLWRSTNAAAPVYEQVDAAAATSATTAGDGVKYAKHQVVVADLTAAAVSQAIVWGTTIPARSLILGSWYRIATVFAGGGAASATVSGALAGGTGIAASVSFIDTQDVFTGATTGTYLNVLNGNQNLGVDANSLFTGTAALAPTTTIASNVNVNLLTTGDVTLYIAYVTGSGITFP